MTHTVTIELPDTIFEYVSEMAQQARQTPEEWIVARLQAITPKSVFMTPAERAEAMARLMQHVGVVSVPDPTGADNEAIDRDLAQECENRHED